MGKIDLKKAPFLKRPLDFILALLGIIASSPLWLLICLAIYLEDRGPIFFIQKRCGKGGKVFSAIKFRSMRVQNNSPHLDIDLVDDPRVTRIGKLLRATGFDELPGLINILKGNMSFVGPRPLPFEIVDEEASLYQNIAEVPGYRNRIKVRPGLTGIAQVYSAKDIPRRAKFRYDSLYVKNTGLCLDLKLIMMSVWITIRGKWEHRSNKI